MEVFISGCYNIAMPNNALLKNNLIESYNHHARERDAYVMDAWKVEERANFLALLQSKNKKSLLEIGAGTGKDSRSHLKNGRLWLKPKLGASQWTLQTNNGQ